LSTTTSPLSWRERLDGTCRCAIVVANYVRHS
jgi:hypothetical protein